MPAYRSKLVIGLLMRGDHLARRGCASNRRVGAAVPINPNEKEQSMSKELRCGDVIPGCSTVIEGKDDKEVMMKATEHAKNAHKMTTIPPDVASKVQQAIHTK